MVEVMGRHCGYLALMGAIAAGADFVLIPESPPDVDNWEDSMCSLNEGWLRGRDAVTASSSWPGRRRIATANRSAWTTSGRCWNSVWAKMRVTILGHVQRGGSPTALDPNLATLTGFAAVDELLAMTPESEPQVIGIGGNRINKAPLMHCVK
ncbi:6-phosphofructokinase [Candidatus Amarobacter glycogenicus]|uniref:6-phosphofructokinase n=1 Tax=Candidatus Amarobacter glycogenicus TaxID=3140699 RepID=UPI0031CCC764